MFGDILLCGDEPYDDERYEDAGAERPEKKKKKRKAAEVDFEAISSAGWSETASLAESELGKKLESERLTRLEEEAARKAAKPEPVVSALAAAEPVDGRPQVRLGAVPAARDGRGARGEGSDGSSTPSRPRRRSRRRRSRARRTTRSGYARRWASCSSSAHPAWLKKADHWSYD